MGETDTVKLFAAVAVCLLVAACGAESSDSDAAGAGDAVKELMASVDAGSCPDVKRIVLTPDAIDCEQIQDLAGSYSSAGVDLDDVSVSVGEVVDRSATVTVDIGSDDDDEQWQVEKVDGSWRVMFDSVE